MVIEQILLFISLGITGINIIGSVIIYVSYVSFLSGAVSIVTTDENGGVTVIDDLVSDRRGIWERLLSFW